MADKPDKKSDAAAAAGKDAAAGGATPEKKGGAGGLLAKTPVMLGGVMLLEAAVLFAGFKFLGGGPGHAAGADIVSLDDEGEAGGGDGPGADGKKPAGKHKTAEVAVLEFKAQNKLSGRTFVYDVSIFVVTKSEFKAQVAETIKEREALIKDRVRTIIAQNDPEKLGGGSEPGLETLRRQVKHQLDEIVGDGLIDEVLIPKCIPIRSDF
jgi:flagellar basal body-associated protein FliL